MLFLYISGRMKQYLLIIIIGLSSRASAQVLQWATSFGGTKFDNGASIAFDSDGNVYTIGSFEGTVDFDPGPGTFSLTSWGGSDVYISKLDANGNFLWAKGMGGVNDDEGISLAIDRLGNIYGAGNFHGGGDFDPGDGTMDLGGLHDFFVLKLDPSGNLIWAKDAGGDSYDYVFSLALDITGNVYTTGHFESGGDFDPGPGTFDLYSPGGYNMFILKLDTDGNFVWAKGLGGASYAQGQSIVVDDTGNLHAIGDFQHTVDFDPDEGNFSLDAAGNSDVFILKLDSDGKFIWAKQLGGAGPEVPKDIELDQFRNILITGTFDGLSDMDPGTGEYELLTNGLFDIFITKLDTDGNFIWAKSVGGSDLDQGSSIDTDPGGNILISGIFRTVADLDPGEAKRNLVSEGEFDAFILKLNPGGDYMWCEQIGGYSTDYITLAVDAFGIVLGTGFIGGTTNLGGLELTSHGVYDALVLKIDANITGTSESDQTSSVDVYPNPSAKVLNIRSSAFPRGATYRITNLVGVQLTTGLLNNPITSIEIGDFAPGIVILEIETMQKKARFKILKK